MVFYFFLLRTESLKTLEQFEVPVLLVITGKPQTLARDISGTQSRIVIRFFYLFVFSSSVTYVKTGKTTITPPPPFLALSKLLDLPSRCIITAKLGNSKHLCKHTEKSLKRKPNIEEEAFDIIQKILWYFWDIF